MGAYEYICVGVYFFTAGQQSNPYLPASPPLTVRAGRGRYKRCDCLIMLKCQQFRWRHKNRLIAGERRLVRRDKRHDRLARSDIAVEQAVHRMRTLNVLEDFVSGLALVVRE